MPAPPGAGWLVAIVGVLLASESLKIELALGLGRATHVYCSPGAGDNCATDCAIRPSKARKSFILSVA